MRCERLASGLMRGIVGAVRADWHGAQRVEGDVKGRADGPAEEALVDDEGADIVEDRLWVPQHVVGDEPDIRFEAF